jgi:hypothetical protein
VEAGVVGVVLEEEVAVEAVEMEIEGHHLEEGPCPALTVHLTEVEVILLRDLSRECMDRAVCKEVTGLRQATRIGRFFY